MRNYFPANEEDGGNLLYITPFVDIFYLKINKRLKNKLPLILEINKGHLKYCAPKINWQKLGKETLDKLLKNYSFIKLFRQRVIVASKEITKFSREVDRLNLEILSDKKISELIKKHHKLFLSLIDYGMELAVMELSNNLLSNHLEILLRNKLKNLKLKKSFALYFQILTETDFKGAYNDEMKDMLKIALKVKKGKSLSQQFKNNPELQKLIKAHTKKYFWLDYAYQGPILTQDYFIKKLKESFKKNSRKTLSRILINEAKIKTERTKAEKELKLNSNEKRLFQSARDCIFIKLYRKDALVFSLAVMHKVLEEISKRTGYSFDQIRAIMLCEIDDLLANEIPKSKLNKRYNRVVYYFKGQKPVLITGNKARDLMKKILVKEKVKNLNYLEGNTACPGQAIGKVKIINTAKDLVKMERGDVLISIATIPEIVPAMKKASAIVTNIGGITSHAAIVSRELCIPCVIGTSMATKIFKDGDKVRVDANHGTIRKLI